MHLWETHIRKEEVYDYGKKEDHCGNWQMNMTPAGSRVINT